MTTEKMIVVSMETPMSEALAHLVGDYVVQSDWMAAEKTQDVIPAAAHAVSYAACFLPLTRNWKALAVIGGTHFVIDRWRLARYVCWFKNQLAPWRYRHKWDSHVNGTGYHREVVVPGMPPDHPLNPMNFPRCGPQSKPDWMSVWLMILADNTMHLIINRFALRRFR